MDRNTLYDESPRPRTGSRAFNRYVEGWTIRETLGANGKKRFEYIYTGDYFYADESKGRRILRKFGYAALYVAAMALLFFCATRRVAANAVGYVGISHAVVLLLSIWVLSGLYTFVTSPEKLFVSDYKSGVEGLQRSSFLLMLSFLLPAITTLVHQFVDPTDRVTELLCVLGYLAGGGLLLLMLWLQRRTIYVRERSAETVGAAMEKAETETDR